MVKLILLYCVYWSKDYNLQIKLNIHAETGNLAHIIAQGVYFYSFK